MSVNITDAEHIKLLNSEDIYGIMQKVLLREEKIEPQQEHFWILGLAEDNRLLFIELIGWGTLEATNVEPMEVFSLALQKQAAKIILCHNQVGGELAVSAKDRDLTDRLLQVGIIVKTNVLDHLIISEKGYLSFAHTGLLRELLESTKYVPPYELVDRIQREAALLADRRVEEVRIQMTLRLKRRGVELETIAEVTGLSLEEIENIKGPEEY